ncbi:class I SAM-dependent methyltransferase [Terracoccus sp. 273MFTsu3.1]|uniref:class I SAM-dependent methyltransferase n=1 Tax=Terracoccus sp. 273MFTsu3.1 TaxID=1172188 RepID=UPI00037AF5BB|nr:class I SAM-dependent methyltransferase [Terracoccus sp. 273MFTsu3.1]
MTHGHHGDAHHAHDDADSEAGGADLLDLDGEVLRDYWDTALDRVAAAVASAPSVAPVRVVDLGAGTGTGSLGLARRLPEAEVYAVDISAPSLARVDAKARVAGVDDRVRTVEHDLDAGWPDLAPVDLTWASMALHHLDDPVRSLGDLRRMTREGGLVAVAEFDEPMRFLPDDLGTGTPGFESRALAVLSAAHGEELPHLGASWAQLLGEAGWTVVAEHEIDIDLPSPDHPLAGRYARTWFDRLAHGLTDRLEAEDLRILEDLLDDDGPHALLHRTDLHLHGVRTVTIARR